MSCLADINKARDLLNKADKNDEPNAKVGMFTEALEILEDCFDNAPSEEELIKIKNIKKAVARNIASQITKMKINNPDVFNYYLTALIKLGDEVKELRDEDNQFNKSLKILNEQFSEEIQLLSKIFRVT